ncbi:hypothetical protein B0H14DRAFT_2817902 [Mycena olivaceomarginata]|nr:hypothetical protein B0H14DRAFT_2817902 [Mycena olivaceomarginata]
MCAFLIPISIHHLAPSSLSSSTRPMRRAGGGASGDTCAALPLLLPLPLPLRFPLLHPAPHTRGRFRIGERRARSESPGALEPDAKKPKSMFGSRRRDGGKKDGRGSGRGCERASCRGTTRGGLRRRRSIDIRAAGMGATGMTLPASRKRDTGEGKHNGTRGWPEDEGETRQDVGVTEKMQRGVRREGAVL